MAIRPRNIATKPLVVTGITPRRRGQIAVDLSRFPGPRGGPGNRQSHPVAGSPAAKCRVNRALANSLGPGPGEPYTVSWAEDVAVTGPAGQQSIRGDDRTSDYQGRGPLKRPDLGEQEGRHGGR